MTFSVQRAIADADLEPFPFEGAEGEPLQLPHMKAFSANQLERLLNRGEVLEVLAEVEADPAIVGSIADWPGHVLEGLVRAWADHSDVQLAGSPGKPQKSSPSSPSTAKPSRRTSRSAASTSRRQASAS